MRMYQDPRCGPDQWLWFTTRWGAGGGRGFGGGARGGRPWWADAMGEPPPRAERGGVRYLVLEAIADQPRHGYEIIQHIEQRAGGSYRPSPGVIYPTLQMLEELEHARVVEQEGRKVYAITETGKAELQENRSTVDEFYARFTEDQPWESYAEDFAELMKRVGRLMTTFRKGAHRGRMSPATMRAIRLALDEALRKIDDVLNGPAR
ncbi:MAG TPA: PadR family transcriptional regulator [Polyangiaceae bacterium]|nr:PadR family transcriptional regulator [Polyangiaceae bacterium]